MTPDGELMDGGGALPPPDISEALPVRCNVEDATLFANVQAAIDGGWPLIARQEPHGVPACIVGGGPSLSETLEIIRAKHDAGCHVYALNGAAHWLIKNGITPYGVIMLDARPLNVSFVYFLPDTIKFLIASQCDPAVFRALGKKDITIWHPNFEGKSGVKEMRETVLIGSGTVVGIRALRLLSVLGYRDFSLFGYDSSYRGEDGHAYPQSFNDGETLVSVKVGGVEYWGAPWMIRQADDFQRVAADMAETGHTFAVYGDGLLPALAQEMARRREPVAGGVLSINYDMATHPASFDYVYWLIAAEMYRKARGFDALDIHFKSGPKDGFRNDELPVDTRFKTQILEHVIKPVTRMIGATISDEPGDDIELAYTCRQITDWSRQGVPVPRLSASWESRAAVKAKHRKPFVCVTLREASYWPQRNSNLEAWTRFADWCDMPVVFVRDTEKADEPLDGYTTEPKASKELDYRLALYEAATLNLFVANGPAALALFSDCNWLNFKILCEGHAASTPYWWENMMGVPPGTQFPWAHKFQRLAWADDTLGNIQAAYASMAAEIAVDQTRKDKR